MERQIRILATGFLILFGLLGLNVNYIQVIAARDLANNPANKRLLIQEYDVQRGQILGADGRTVIGTSQETEGALKYLRRYPQESLYAHLSGYYSFVFGRSGLEQSYNDELSGRAPEVALQTFVDEVLGRDRRGASLVLTIDPQLQQTAAAGLGDRPGAVAAINPQTGEVLALVSNPSFDPNVLSSHDGKSIRKAWNRLNADPEKPLLSAASEDFFPPGSTFKILVAAAALENGITPDTTFPNPPELDLPQTTETLENFGGDHCLGGAPEVSLAEALQISCNVVFAEVGLELGAEKLAEQARAFGFSGDIPFDKGLRFQEGNFPPAESFAEDLPGVAFSAIGQKDVRTNVLHLALIGGAIGNGGVMMQPKVVREVRDPTGRIVRRLQPQVFGNPLSPENAGALTQMMQAVVDSGTGTAAQISGISVAGKTGTAQNPGGDPHAWFVAFAPAEQPTVAVAVVVLNGGDLGSEATGGAVAAPIARTVMEEALTSP